VARALVRAASTFVSTYGNLSTLYRAATTGSDHRRLSGPAPEPHSEKQPSEQERVRYLQDTVRNPGFVQRAVASSLLELAMRERIRPCARQWNHARQECSSHRVFLRILGSTPSLRPNRLCRSGRRCRLDRRLPLRYDSGARIFTLPALLFVLEGLPRRGFRRVGPPLASVRRTRRVVSASQLLLYRELYEPERGRRFLSPLRNGPHMGVPAPSQVQVFPAANQAFRRGRTLLSSLRKPKRNVSLP
jgi:hypothetical protein